MNSVKIGDIKIKNPIALSPMAGISSLPFRIICNEMGAGYCPTELVSARSIRYNGVGKSMRYMRISPEEEGITAIQLFGSEPDDFKAAIETILDTPVLKEVSIIDINMGCPVPKVVKTGSGSALMEDPARAAAIVKATRPQMYHGESSNQAIAVMREAVRDYKIPFFANGDICDTASAKRIIEETGCDGIMIGRAARGNPWVFEQVIAGLAGNGEPKYPDADEKKLMLMRELEGRMKYLPEEVAVREFRSVMPFYIKGLTGSAQIKVKLCSATGIEEIKEILGIV